jgi:hypothetical protein
MGSMSASDAAPLPRLGEVYFDVRGESRSMRLSWYADTGVAVFSIWQGGTCTGTFRLPIADLPRMIEALQRGPSTGPEPDTGYSDPGFPAAAASKPEGYGRTGAHVRYEETRAVYPDEGLPGAGGYREGRAAAYADEPQTGVYHDGGSEDAGGRRLDRPGGHQDDPLSPTYRADPYDDPLSSGYGDDPLPAGYRADPHDDPLHGGYGDASLPGGYRDESRGGPYRADSLPGGYRADMGRGHHDDPLSAGYASEPRGGGRGVDPHRGDYADDPLTGAYPGERHTGGYPDDPRSGYPDDPRGGYADEPMTARYRADSPSGDYPTGPSDPAIDDPDYPPPAGNAGYSPARPYVAPVPDGPRGTGEGRGGRRRGGGREESDPSPDSFPYGRPPAEPEVRSRRR